MILALREEIDTDMTIAITRNLGEFTSFAINGGLMNKWTSVVVR